MLNLRSNPAFAQEFELRKKQKEQEKNALEHRRKSKKWRVLVRFSIETVKDVQLHAPIYDILRKAGLIQNSKTGTWESPANDPSKTATQLSAMLKHLAASGDLDHVWIYIDQVPGPAAAVAA